MYVATEPEECCLEESKCQPFAITPSQVRLAKVTAQMHI